MLHLFLNILAAIHAPLELYFSLSQLRGPGVPVLKGESGLKASRKNLTKVGTFRSANA